MQGMLNMTCFNQDPHQCSVKCLLIHINFSVCISCQWVTPDQFVLIINFQFTKCKFPNCTPSLQQTHDASMLSLIHRRTSKQIYLCNRPAPFGQLWHGKFLKDFFRLPLWFLRETYTMTPFFSIILVTSL